ncbi:MAG: efflux RND transporter periplasmic adaptor subunit [Acidobacteria bacterium]|nr:efflux RND transporter periplasmic adaptor subunit [Acidobacteriota bacterium]
MKITSIIILVALPALAGCGGHAPEKGEAKAPPAVQAQVTEVKTVDVADGYTATGTVRARDSVTVSSKAMGSLVSVHVKQGDKVGAGQLLAVVDARDMAAQHKTAQAGVEEARTALAEVDQGIRAAQVQLDLARTTYGRMKALREKDSVSKQEFDEAETRLKLAEANQLALQARRSQVEAGIRRAEAGAAAAETVLAFARITAPFAGTVTEKLAEPGTLAAPGVPLFIIERGGGHRLEVAVDESRLGAITVGQTVRVTLDAFGESFDAAVAEVLPTLNPLSRTATVKIDLPSREGLRSGLFGRAVFGAGARKALTVPREAVQTRGQIQWVFAVEEGVARNRMVTLGEGAGPGGPAEVLTGLAEGEKVVCPVPPGLRDGVRVEVRP